MLPNICVIEMRNYGKHLQGCLLNMPNIEISNKEMFAVYKYFLQTFQGDTVCNGCLSTPSLLAEQYLCPAARSVGHSLS